MITRRSWIFGVALSAVAAGCRRRQSPTNGPLTASDPVDPAFTACAASCGLRSAKDRAAARTQPGGAHGDVVFCPVSGAVFRVSEKSPSRKAREHTLYFCCPACATWFDAHEAHVLTQRGIG